jgi:acetoin utilization deacetylase AcuC-like enzyme
VRDVEAHRPSSGYVQVDPDTRMNPFTFQAAKRASGAAVLATGLVIKGDARVAFCNVRPPGHHAGRASAAGFCFFNNVAVGIRHALNVHGLERVALIDFDVHHGNGSENILHEDSRVLMCSTFEEGVYPFSGAVPMGPNMVNVSLPSRSGSKAFRTSVSETWIPALEKFKPQMIFISAGFDGHREDDMGNLGLVEDDYAWVTAQIVKVANTYAKGRIVSCLEGGYVLSPLGRSAAAHVKVLIGAD